ncbi:hypothetical protein N0V84_008564 [Fusarium piperis]|uniref:Uncharacterized protein n=1 Tax=Fusarium piperis TaxID=1435070 RepID=A0A9W8W7X1_9HYPO|nr:hypothetical protein N0V84_008564 [Fusarium piperis]
MSQSLTTVHKEGLAVLVREQEKRTLSVTATIKDMASSEFFRQNWDELLVAAPNCLELLRNINAMASTKLASTTPLKAPAKGFTYLKDYGNLKGGLAQLTNKGNIAFTCARINIDKINGLAGTVPAQLEILVDALADPDVPMSVALTALESMRDTAQYCYNSAMLVQTDMIDWSGMCMELEEACVAEGASTETRHQKAALNLTLAADEEKFRLKQEEDVKKELNKIGTHLDDAKKNYQKALDDMPAGMDLVGQQILMGLGEAVSSAITIGAAAGAAYINPVAGVGTSVKTLAEEFRKADQAPGGGKPNSTSTTTKDGKAKVPDADTANERKSQTLSKLTTEFIRRAKPKDGEAETASMEAPPASKDGSTPASYGAYDLSGKFYPDDAALGIVPGIKASIDELKNIIVGAPDGINWAAVIAPEDPAKGTVSECRRISHALHRLVQDMRPRKGGLASQLTTAIVTEAIGVADELEAEAENSKDLKTWRKPDVNSAFYKDLEMRISRCASTALALDTVSKSTPGGVGAAGASLSVSQQTPEEKIASMNHKASIAEQTIKSATVKLESSQQMYAATLETYQKQTERVLLVQDNLMRARQQVTSLTNEKLTLVVVKKVLVECISYLSDLKDRIGKLVIFFSGLTNMIDVCIKGQVEPFQKQIQNYAKTNDSKALLFREFFRDIRLQTTQVSKLNITNVNDKVSDEAYLQKSKTELSNFCKSAETTVRTII